MALLPQKLGTSWKKKTSSRLTAIDHVSKMWSLVKEPHEIISKMKKTNDTLNCC